MVTVWSVHLPLDGVFHFLADAPSGGFADPFKWSISLIVQAGPKEAPTAGSVLPR